MANKIKASVATIRQTRVTNAALQLLFQDADRRFYLIQNLDLIESIEVTSVAGGSGERIPPTGALLIDLGSANELWARNPNNANPVAVAIHEISGYTPWEVRMLFALERIAEMLEAATSGRR